MQKRSCAASCWLDFFLLPDLALAQASPFLTGANALQTNILAWLTPIAVILVMVLGGMAMANRISWGWCIGAIIGIAIAFRRTADRDLGPRHVRGVSRHERAKCRTDR